MILCAYVVNSFDDFLPHRHIGGLNLNWSILSYIYLAQHFFIDNVRNLVFLRSCLT